MGSPSCGREPGSYHTSRQNNDAYRPSHWAKGSTMPPLGLLEGADLAVTFFGLAERAFFFLFEDFFAPVGAASLGSSSSSWVTVGAAGVSADTIGAAAGGAASAGAGAAGVVAAGAGAGVSGRTSTDGGGFGCGAGASAIGSAIGCGAAAGSALTVGAAAVVVSGCATLATA